MALNFQAYSIHLVLDSLQKKVEALEAVSDGLLLGLADSTLLLLKPDPADPKGKWQVCQTFKNICKRSSTQLQVSVKSWLCVWLHAESISETRTGAKLRFDPTLSRSFTVLSCCHSELDRVA